MVRSWQESHFLTYLYHYFKNFFPSWVYICWWLVLARSQKGHVCVYEKRHLTDCVTHLFIIYLLNHHLLSSLKKKWHSLTQEIFQKMNLVTKLWKLRKCWLMCFDCAQCACRLFVTIVPIVEVGLGHECPLSVSLSPIWSCKVGTVKSKLVIRFLG